MNEEIAYTAMCIWEDHLERIESEDNVLNGYRETHGAQATRYMVLIDIAPVIDEAWNDLVKNYDPCFAFDWEFIPEVMCRISTDDLIPEVNKQLISGICCEAFSDLKDDYEEKDLRGG